MVYFPKIEEGPAVPTKCPGCAKWYVPNPARANVSCCVMHYPGSCCHYSETEVPAPEEIPAERRVEVTQMGDAERKFIEVFGDDDG